jgi:hypothetical protein
LGTLIALPVLIWALSFIDLARQEKCSFGPISDTEYQTMLSRARAQPWTVWPGLSNGVFFPSDDVFRFPITSFETKLSSQILANIHALVAADRSIDRQLAAAHAVMRSIGAEYVSVMEVPDMGSRVNSHIAFKYFVPQIRFAPACLLCLLWRHATIDVILSHDRVANQYELEGINVLFSQLKYNPGKETVRNVASGECPSLSISPQSRG